MDFQPIGQQGYNSNQKRSFQSLPTYSSFLQYPTLRKEKTAEDTLREKYVVSMLCHWKSCSWNCLCSTGCYHKQIKIISNSHCRITSFKYHISWTDMNKQPKVRILYFCVRSSVIVNQSTLEERKHHLSQLHFDKKVGFFCRGHRIFLSSSLH